MALPEVSSFLQNGFLRFLPRMLRKNFHAIAADRSSLAHAEIPRDQPLIVFANHPSWWDPLLAQFLCRRLFAPRQFFAPIDADALQQYRVFAKLGFYGVRSDSASGSAAFLRTSRAILDHPETSIWLTPEGRFADPRDHAVPLAPGLAHLASRIDRGVLLPLALEYAFWDERLPVCFTRFGEPLHADQHGDWDKTTWQDALTRTLRQAQQELAKKVIARDAAPFQLLLRGGRGAGGSYQFLRRVRALMTRQPIPEQHGDQFQ